MKTKLLVVLAVLLTAAVSASAKVTEKFSQTYPLAANGRIHLENVNGFVEIIAWDKAEVALEAEKGARDQDALARIHLKIEADADRLQIKTELEKRWKLWDHANAYVNYKLHVPAGVSLDKIDVVNAGIRVEGVKGYVNLDTVNGAIVAKGLAGRGRFDTVNGSIDVTYSDLTGVAGISLDTTNGGCTLTLPADAAFRLDADTVNGHVSCDFPITLEKSGKHALRGTVNGGGTEVKLDTVNGSLRVERAK